MASVTFKGGFQVLPPIKDMPASDPNYNIQDNDGAADAGATTGGASATPGKVNSDSSMGVNSDSSTGVNTCAAKARRSMEVPKVPFSSILHRSSAKNKKKE